MKEIRNIDFFLKQGQDFHKDFIMNIPDIEIHKAFDSYYFWPMNSVLGRESDEVKNQLNKYFKECKSRIKILKVDEKLFIPIDFSDQYYGGFMIQLSNEGLFTIHWGTIRDINTAVFESRDGRLYHNLSDREFENDFTFIMNRENFIESFLIIDLRNLTDPAS